jgi:hypothetical protein
MREQKVRKRKEFFRESGNVNEDLMGIKQRDFGSILGVKKHEMGDE